MRDRIKNAIEFLKERLPFKVGELYFGIDDSDCLNVTGASRYIYLESVTKQTSLAELNEIKSSFGEMISSSIEFREFVGGKKIKFNLDFDYGMGDIRICSEKGGILKWEAQISE